MLAAKVLVRLCWDKPITSYLMFLKRSEPNPASSFSNSFSSGIIGGGGPDGRDWVGVEPSSSIRLERLTWLSPVNRLNQPLLLFDFRSSRKLLPPRLVGRLTEAADEPLPFDCCPSAYELFSIVLLNRRRRLPGRADAVGLGGMSSAGRLVPARLPFDVACLLAIVGSFLVTVLSCKSAFAPRRGV